MQITVRNSPLLVYRLRAQDVPCSEWQEVQGGAGAMGTIVNVAYDNGMTVEFALRHPA